MMAATGQSSRDSGTRKAGIKGPDQVLQDAAASRPDAQVDSLCASNAAKAFRPSRSASRLLWDDVRENFDPHLNGTLPDVRIVDTTVDDWQSVLDLVRSRGWRYEYQEDGRTTRMPARADDILGRVPRTCPVVRVWPAPDLLAIFRPAVAEAIEFDVDLRDLQGQAEIDGLCAFLRAIGRCLNRAVLMYPEGGGADPDVGYLPDVGRVVNLASRLEPPDQPGRDRRA
ncbi:MAG TPA: hypothetical protein VF163_01210 [Micromonosporaceae bacterium]